MTSEWQSCRLGDLVEIAHGYAFPGEFFTDTETPFVVVTPGNFRIGGGFTSRRPKYYGNEGPLPPRFVLSAGDLIVTMTDLSKASDTLGVSAVVPRRSGVHYLHNQRIGKVSQREGAPVELAFIHWLLRSALYRNHVVATATGTTVKHTSPSRIADFAFRLPELDEQRRIAGVLDALDYQIEGEERLGRLIERVGGLLLDAALTERKGEPRSLGDFLCELETGSRPRGGTRAAAGDAVPSIGAESIVAAGSFDFSKTKFVPRKFFDDLKRGRLVGLDVLLYKDGAGIGASSIVGEGFPFGESCINEHVYRVRVKPPYGQALLYFWLRRADVVEELRQSITGAAIPV